MEPRADEMCRVQTDLNLCDDCKDDCKDGAKMIAKTARQRASETQPSNPCVGRAPEDTQRHTTTTTSADLLGEGGCEDSQPLQCFMCDRVMEPRADEMCRVQTDLNLCDDCKDGCKDGAKMIAKIARQRASRPSNPCVGPTSLVVWSTTTKRQRR